MGRKFSGTAAGIIVISLAVAGTWAAASGRYKKEGDRCVWNATDTGPNQCVPTVEGRFKKSGDTCTWAANDKGADECRPAKGRFKADGTACVWNASDSGPDQCDSRKPK